MTSDPHEIAAAVPGIEASAAASDNALSDTLAVALGARLQAAGLTVTTAESCTGGLIAAAITGVAGSSAWFRAAVVTYANAAKVQLADVPAAVLAEHGAVSEATVLAMARGTRRRLAADVAIAVSGIAGPGGAVPGKPVGTVWIAVALGDDVRAERHRFAGDRASVRRQAVIAALRATLSAIESTV